MNVLICGDSFSLDWSKWEDIPYKGWPNLIADLHSVDNRGQHGVGQYKIFKQLQHLDLSTYNKIIVSVAPYWRMHCQSHPIHTTARYRHCDLMLMDIDRFDWFNSKLRTAKGIFKYYYDEEHLKDTHDMVTDRIRDKLKDSDYILIGHTGTTHNDVVDFSKLWEQESGLVNHYNQKGNQYIFDALQPFLESKK
tara:strand:+ start:471 stop:1049 length:579 start_codon:yes stop_codon:yes gene_type:complete